MNKIHYESYKAAVEDMVLDFTEKQDIPYEYNESDWVAEEVGGIICIGDDYFNFNDIMTDLRNNAPIGEIYKWFRYCNDVATLSNVINENAFLSSFKGDIMRCHCNYSSWLMGASSIMRWRYDRLLETVNSIRMNIRDLTDKFFKDIERFKNNEQANPY